MDRKNSGGLCGETEQVVVRARRIGIKAALARGRIVGIV